jgi:hypothetical protein
MPRAGFERTITVFERAKTVHALDHAATVIGCLLSSGVNQFKQGCANKLLICGILFCLLNTAQENVCPEKNVK